MKDLANVILVDAVEVFHRARGWICSRWVTEDSDVVAITAGLTR
jgi:hypothetical protein